MKSRPEQTRRRNDLLRDLAESVSVELAKYGLSEEQARTAGEEVALAIHDNWRGLSVVFPMRPELAMRRLRLQILTEYTGNNIGELVRKYHVAENTIYKWVNEEHRRRVNQNQAGFNF